MFEGTSDVAVGLAFCGASGFVYVGLGVASHPGDGDRVLVSSGATPANDAKAASLRTRPWWDQLISSCAGTTGPRPGSPNTDRSNNEGTELLIGGGLSHPEHLPPPQI